MSHTPVPPPDEATPPTKADKVGPQHIERLRSEVQRLSLKARVQLIDALRDGLVSDGEGGVRYSARSLTEYKRVTKTKGWDAPIVRWIDSFTESDVFYDIGANLGPFSLLTARRHGGRVRIFAFEPGFESFEALARNVLLNSMGSVITPLQVALSDETGLQPFNYYTLGTGSARHALGEPVDYTGATFAPAAVQHVLAFRLDDLVERFNVPAPTRIKIDVDGNESRVLAGAARTLSRQPCELWMEIIERDAADATPAALIALLEGFGFELADRIEHGEPDRAYPRYGDLFFVRR